MKLNRGEFLRYLALTDTNRSIFAVNGNGLRITHENQSSSDAFSRVDAHNTARLEYPVWEVGIDYEAARYGAEAKYEREGQVIETDDDPSFTEDKNTVLSDMEKTEPGILAFEGRITGNRETIEGLLNGD